MPLSLSLITFLKGISLDFSKYFSISSLVEPLIMRCSNGGMICLSTESQVAFTSSKLLKQIVIMDNFVNVCIDRKVERLPTFIAGNLVKFLRSNYIKCGSGSFFFTT